MVCPTQWQPLIHAAQGQIDVGISVVSQLTFSEYLESRGFERHLTRMRKDYAGRRRELVASLMEHFPKARISGIAAGLHLMVNLGTGGSAPALSARALQAGMRFYPIDRYFLGDKAPANYENGPVIVLGFGAMPLHSIRGGVSALAELAHGPGKWTV